MKPHCSTAHLPPFTRLTVSSWCHYTYTILEITMEFPFRCINPQKMELSSSLEVNQCQDTLMEKRRNDVGKHKEGNMLRQSKRLLSPHKLSILVSIMNLLIYSMKQLVQISSDTNFQDGILFPPPLLRQSRHFNSRRIHP